MAKKTKKIRVKLVKSLIGRLPQHRATAKALGLGKVNSIVEKEVNPAVQGMVDSISFLVSVEEIK